MLCDRPYRSALDDQQALEALTSSAGTECDPYVVSALLALLADLRAGIEEHVASEAANAEPFDLEEQDGQQYDQTARESISVPTATEPARNTWSPHSVTPAEAAKPEAEQATRPWGEGLKAFTPTGVDSSEQLPTRQQPDGVQASNQVLAERRETKPAPPFIQLLLERASSTDFAAQTFQRWPEWNGSRNNKKELLGFQASVLRQLEFRSIAIPFWSEARLDLYLKGWGKVIYANDSRVWAGVLARANVEAGGPLGEETIARILENVYIPGTKLANADLRRWFSETDAWWMDNLRRNIELLEDQVMRAQALALGIQTGDYALSFNEKTLELRRPLTTVFWRLAGRTMGGPTAQPHNRAFNLPAEEFIKQARADLLYLRTPSSQTEVGGSQARSDWRETWVNGAAGDDSTQLSKKSASPQSKQSYLSILDRLFRIATNFKRWAVECQEPGLATAQDIVELVKEYRPVKATYSKDVTEVVGGLRSYIIVGESTSPR